MEDNKILIMLFIRSQAEENVKNGPLLSPRGRLHSISVETGRITDYKWIEKLHYYLTAAASTSVCQLSTSIHVTDDADISIFLHDNVRGKKVSDALSSINLRQNEFWSHNTGKNTKDFLQMIENKQRSSPETETRVRVIIFQHIWDIFMYICQVRSWFSYRIVVESCSISIGVSLVINDMIW